MGSTNESAPGSHKKFYVLISIISVITVVIFYLATMPSVGVGYAPPQPIPFSHKLHAGERKIECAYCHSQVGEAQHSNVPPVSTCINCHQVVKTDSPHIQKLLEAYNTNTPIEWVNVYVLPDYVYFNHERHIKAGVSCTHCHGNVQEMDVVYQAKPLTMGFCVNCHRSKSTPEKQVSIECSTCHR